MSKLDQYRENIDEIDAQLVRLFEQRLSTVRSIAEYKLDNNMKIFDASRENQIREKVKKSVLTGEFDEGIISIMNYIMDNSKDYQRALIKELSMNKKLEDIVNVVRVGYQGVPGSYSEEALIQYFGEDVDSDNYNSFEDVFVALKNDEVDYGVLPIENSSTGAIKEVYDLLGDYGFFIVGEEIVKVSHNLLGIKGSKVEDIEEIYSHQQGLEQCSNYFKNNKGVRFVPYANTAMSAKYVYESNCFSKGAIASKRAALLYSLEILDENINDQNGNFTRFIVISKERKEGCSNKVSIVIELNDKVGALYDVLSHFKEKDLTMVRIESRPVEGEPWKYHFYIDFEGDITSDKVLNLLLAIKKDSAKMRLLGNYLKAK